MGFVMDFWIKKAECTGCSACVNKCSKSAISLVSDEDGFLYPQIDNSICINCGLCENVCPIYALKTNNIGFAFSQRALQPTVYQAISKNDEIRFNSTSGGFFSELATYILSQNGKVCGAAYDEENMVHHIIIDNGADISKVRQSKYVQSEIGAVYQSIKESLIQGKTVLFCGTPCQVAGLYHFLEKEYENLITMEFICLGVNSPKAYKYWLKELENKKKKKISRVWFKYKEYGWKKSPLCTRIDYVDGSYIVLQGKKNDFMRGYLEGNLYLRPCCSICKFKEFPRYADYTVGDFWGIQNDDDKGTSVILLNSKKSELIFENIKTRIKHQSCDIDEVINGNPRLVSSILHNELSHAFLQEIERIPFSQAIHKYIRHKHIVVRSFLKVKNMLSNL